MNAHKINAGEPVELNQKEQRIFFFVKCDEADTIIRGNHCINPEKTAAICAGTSQ